MHTYDHELTPQVIVTAIDEDGRHVGAPVAPPVVYEHTITFTNLETEKGAGGLLHFEVRNKNGGHPTSGLTVTLTIPVNMQGLVCLETVNGVPIYTKDYDIPASFGNQMVNIYRVPGKAALSGTVTINATGKPDTNTSLKPGSGTITVVAQ